MNFKVLSRKVWRKYTAAKLWQNGICRSAGIPGNGGHARSCLASLVHWYLLRLQIAISAFNTSWFEDRPKKEWHWIFFCRQSDKVGDKVSGLYSKWKTKWGSLNLKTSISDGSTDVFCAYNYVSLCLFLSFYENCWIWGSILASIWSQISLLLAQ